MGGGKGNSQPSTTSTTTKTELPAWLETSAQGAIKQAEELSDRPYVPYTGDIVADTSGDTLQAYQQIRDMQGQTAPAFDLANNQWQGVLGNLQSLTPEQQAAVTNQLFGNYKNVAIDPVASLFSGYTGQGPLTTASVASGARDLMSPYTDAVIDPARELGRQELAKNLQTIGAGASQAGAFGGSRQGILEGTAQSQTALGSEALLAKLLNDQWGKSIDTSYNVGALGSKQGFDATAALAGLYGSGFQNANTTAANLLGTNLQLGATAADKLPQLATAEQDALQKQTSLLQTIGAAQTGQQQQELNALMGQFYEGQDFPVQNLDILLAALSGTPYGTTTTATSTGAQPRRNAAAGVLGGAGSGAAIGSMFAPGIGTAIGAVAGGILGGLN